MDRERMDDIIDNATDLRSVYDKIPEEELKGMSFEQFVKFVDAIPEGDDDELTEAQMETVAGGVAGFDDFTEWFSKKGIQKVKELCKEIKQHFEDTFNDIIGPGM